MVLLAIWNRRNNLIHHRPCLLVGGLVPWCKAFLSNFLKANAAVPPPIPNRFVRWIPPIQNVYKLNTDATLDDKKNITGLGAIMRDSSGAVMFSCIDSIVGLLALKVAETKAILFGLSAAIEGGITSMIIEYDCAPVIKMLNDGSEPLSEIGVIISDIQGTLRYCNSSVKFSYVYRNGNLVAQSLAKLAIIKNKVLVWVEDVPLSTGSLVETDSSFIL
ncbi:hypothetical protein ACOSP7_032695 [Xanthoceras sorbifolium]